MLLIIALPSFAQIKAGEVPIGDSIHAGFSLDLFNYSTTTKSDSIDVDGDGIYDFKFNLYYEDIKYGNAATITTLNGNFAVATDTDYAAEITHYFNYNDNLQIMGSMHFSKNPINYMFMLNNNLVLPPSISLYGNELNYQYIWYRNNITNKDGWILIIGGRNDPGAGVNMGIINYLYTGIVNGLPIHNLTISPNPAKDIVTISGSNIKKVILLDFIGRSVVSKESGITNTINLALGNLSKGVYIVKAIYSDGSIKTEKLLVE